MATLKAQHRKHVENRLIKEMGRPPVDAEEQLLVEAAAKSLSTGVSSNKIENMYGLAHGAIREFLNGTFATDEDRYKFIEEAMLANATLAMKVFNDKHDELSAVDAARVSIMFAGKATEIRKARLADFKEPTINILTIQRLEKNLQVISERTL